MIRTILYSLIIMLFFAFLFVVGLFGPDQGRKVVQRVLEFVNWKPAPQSEGVLSETEAAIKQFNNTHQSVQVIRQMTLDRSKKSFLELQSVYAEAHDQLKLLLSQMGESTPEKRKEMFDRFSALHTKRAGLVEEIIRTQQTLININEQMDQQLRAMTQWLNDKTTKSAMNPSTRDVLRLQQLDNLKSTLKAFNNESSQLDAMRILFMTKSKETVQRLAVSNNELENRFREIIAQIESATAENKPQLWEDYQKIEMEQRELVSALNANEDFISENHSKMLSGVSTISQSVEYRTDNQLERFRDSFQMMESQRKDMIISMRQRQQDFLDSQPSIKQIMENNNYRMELMREQARQISDQFTRMEEYRKSTASVIQSMTEELKDQAQFASRQSEEIMERNRNRIDGFMRQMDAVQVNLDQFIRNNQRTALADSSTLHRIINLNERIDALKASIKESEEQRRSVQLRLEQNQDALSQAAKDTKVSYDEKLLSVKQQTEDQKRVFSERVKDQIQTLKDKQANQLQK